MQSVLVLYKPVGPTPLELIREFQMHHPEYASQTMSYAGRLDPMAEGILLVLVGDENKRRHDYEKLSKTYVFTILGGVATDTYDLLGLIDATSDKLPNNLSEQINKLVPDLTGTQIQAFPPYSSKPVKGKPLYWWARAGRLTEIEIPTKSIEIVSLTIAAEQLITKDLLQEEIRSRIGKVHGNFRQGAILERWESFFQTTQRETFPLIQCTVVGSSGMYVRELVHTLAERLNNPATTFSILRTQIGNYTSADVRSFNEAT